MSNLRLEFEVLFLNTTHKIIDVADQFFSAIKTFLYLCSHRLEEEFPQWFEKPVLEIVHHNTVSLDKLVEKAWLEILTKYAVGEECDFLVS